MPRLVAPRIRSAYLSLTSALGGAPLGILVCLMVLTAASWALTLYEALSMSAPMGPAMEAGMADQGLGAMPMGGMAASGWSLAALGVFVALWTLMMVAMMLPAAAPMILIFAAAQARRAPRVAVPTWIFVAGYMLVWAAAGLIIYVLVQIGAEAVGQFGVDRSSWAPLGLGITLAAAGLYQFTPLKRICLRHCRSPLAFVAQFWREGRIGALRMGFRHGLYCFGCCWALFAVLVAAGIMSIAWMLLLSVIVFAEKVLPHGPRTSAAVGVGLIALALLVASGVWNGFTA